MERSYIEEQSFEKIDYTLLPFPNGEYEHCIFTNCNFSNAQLSHNDFIDCEFVGCNFSNTKLLKVVLSDVKFINCKLIGIQFDTCNDFGLSFSFINCILNHYLFFHTHLLGPFVFEELSPHTHHF